MENFAHVALPIRIWLNTFSLLFNGRKLSYIYLLNKANYQLKLIFNVDATCGWASKWKLIHRFIRSVWCTNFLKTIF